MDNKLLRKLIKRLPHDFGIILAEQTGYSKSYVLKVLWGERKNTIILAAALELAQKHTDKETMITEGINNL